MVGFRRPYFNVSPLFFFFSEFNFNYPAMHDGTENKLKENNSHGAVLKHLALLSFLNYNGIVRN